jgi:hypothetical protein
MDVARKVRILILLLAAWVAGMLLLVWFQASVDCQVAATEWPKQGCRLTKFLFDWQQLIGALFTLLAAGFAWMAIDRQVKQADRLEQGRTGAKRAGARAALPSALDAICDYAEECAQNLALMIPRDGQEGLPRETEWQGPPPPTGALLDVRTLIETLPLRDGSAFATLLANIQVQSSRLSSMRPSRLPNHVHVIVRSNLEQGVVDCADIYARSEAFFPYARGESENVPHDPPTREDIESALRKMGSLDALSRIDERLDRYFARRAAQHEV